MSEPTPAAPAVNEGKKGEEKKAATPAKKGGNTPAKPKPAVPEDDPELNRRYAIARSVGEECIQEAELKALLHFKPEPRCYDGFEPSGRMHIAQGLLKAINVNKLTSVGCRFVFWVADWFALMNNKMGGDLKKIRKVGEYMIEVWKAAGMDMDRVEFLWSSDEINNNSNEYWLRVMDIARHNSINRIKRCATIMGRQESDEMPAAQVMYPCMQAADIFFLKADICQLGMDQRKVNMLAREYCDAAKIKFKPVILSHHMLSGLKQGQEKMSKSDPNSAIFMEDSADEVRTKIKKAFCPEGQVEGNPILDYTRHVVFAKYGKLEIVPKEGEPVMYEDVDKLEAAFAEKKIHPADLKTAVAAAINLALEPVREHFKSNKQAAQLLKTIKSYKVTK